MLVMLWNGRMSPIAFLSFPFGVRNMKFLHWDFTAGPDNVIKVELDKQANVLLLDDINFGHYQSGGSYRNFGGLAKRSPATLVPPHIGHWHVVIDLGGYAGSVRAFCSMA
jgi:hypothetical protein